MMKVGQRARTLPHTDAWMRGDRYGDVVRVVSNPRGTWYHVRMERSAKVRYHHALNVEAVD